MASLPTRALPLLFRRRLRDLLLVLLALLAVLGRPAIWARPMLGAVPAARGLAAMAALRFSRRASDFASRRAWRLLAVGMLLWTAADLWYLGPWILAGVVGNIPGPADLLRLAGYLGLLGGLAVYPALAPERFGRIRAGLDIAMALVAVFALAWLVLIRPLFELQVASMAPLFWLSGVLILDLMFLALWLRLFLLLGHGRGRRPFLAMGLAWIAILAGDLSHLFQVVQGPWQPGGWMEVAWTVGALAFVSAAAGMPFPTQGEPRGARLGRRLEAVLPVAYAYLVVGYTVLDWSLRGQVDWFGLAGSVAMGVLLVARQGVIVGQMEMRQFAALVHASADLAFICEPDGTLRLVNPAMRRALGLPEEGRRQSLGPFIVSEEPLRALLDRALEGAWQGEVNLRRSDGTTFPVALSLRPVRDERGGRPLIVGTAHDLTSLKAREQELRTALAEVAAARRELEALNQALEQKVQERTRELEETVAHLERLNEQLKELDRLKSEFVALVSHELRAPLTNIRTGIELLLQTHKDLAPPVAETLRLIQEETLRLSSFVESILDLSALEAGRFPLRAEPLDLAEVAATVQERFASRPDRDRLRVDIPADLPRVWADARALGSVLFHLMDNAFKYAPEGEILVRAQEDHGKVVVRVCDRGPGIPTRERERVFDMFHRLDSRDAREVYGYGLGLHLARRMLEAMGGGIRVEADDEPGAQFVFWLPRA